MVTSGVDLDGSGLDNKPGYVLFRSPARNCPEEPSTKYCIPCCGLMRSYVWSWAEKYHVHVILDENRLQQHPQIGARTLRSPGRIKWMVKKTDFPVAARVLDIPASELSGLVES